MREADLTPQPGHSQYGYHPYNPWEIGYKVYKKQGHRFKKSTEIDYHFRELASVPGPSYKP